MFIKRALLSVLTNDFDPVTIVFLKKKLPIRKTGKMIDQISPIFPGYVFLETGDFPEPLYWAIRTTPGFYRYLPENKNPLPLSGKDLSTIKHFLSFGEVADISKVQFDENNRIIVVEGPLKGLEGSIIKVDRRKCRAKVKLDMYNDSFPVDLAFEILGKK
ncbi:antiterminator LoaP [Brucepastera parasyntrophica]|uniref:antiterminator LoaP n=1 Tax=Brucepastera parasyntrophica TaxID=2880008 RepID=UPI003F71F2F9